MVDIECLAPTSDNRLGKLLVGNLAKALTLTMMFIYQTTSYWGTIDQAESFKRESAAEVARLKKGCEEVKQETKLADNVVSRSLKSLSAKNLIKEVVNFQNKAKKHYMAVEFEPSKEISGGEWYVDGHLNKELINVLKQLCFRHMRSQKVATLEGVHNELKKNRVVTFDIASQQIGEILNSMVLDNDIIEFEELDSGHNYKEFKQQNRAAYLL
ncbi:hypothetical protein Pfo_000414 [Paulownia fortunei]|nr:hypothetical protein Pfo_000414 [Paulownia fortunei]